MKDNKPKDLFGDFLETHGIKVVDVTPMKETETEIGIPPKGTGNSPSIPKDYRRIISSYVERKDVGGLAEWVKAVFDDIRLS